MREDQLEYVRLIVLAVLVGVFAALGNLGFRELIEFSSWLFRSVEWRLLGIPRGRAFVLLIPIVLLSGGAAILILDYFFPGDVMGYGFPNFLEMVNLGGGRIKRTWIFVKAAGAALSLGSGASVGREGPIAQIGGAIGAAVGQIGKLSADRSRVLIAAGAGAGIATTFNAPIGGLLFAQEIVLLGQTELANLSLLVIATFSGVVTSRAILGDAAVFHVQPFVLRSYWEIMTYTLMGALIGLVAAGYIRFFHATARAFRRLGIPNWAKLAAGLALVGMIAIVLPENLSDGYPVIDLALAGQLAAPRMAILAMAKIVASSISLGCGAPGGVFGPIFFIGTMTGGSFRLLSSILLPGLTGPRGSYALVGMGALLAGTTHAPLTAILLLTEMTQDYTVTLPAMISAIMALLVARAIESESIDTYRLAREGKTLHIGRERRLLSQIPVDSVMVKDVNMVTEGASLPDILRVAGETPQTVIPVVDGEGNLSGLIVTRDLVGILAGGAELGPLVNAYDLCRRNPPVVMPESSLYDATQLMEHEALDELPVVEAAGNPRFLGLVARRNIAQAANRVAVSLSTLATPDNNIFWATGYRVARVRVPAAAVGSTLRTLDPRARFGVTVLALQDSGDSDAGFVTVDPGRRLKSGDLMVVAGRPADLRRFERELEATRGDLPSPGA
ncbi:MAG: chloride channel protein [Candidatus Binatales bacterium]